MDRAPAVILLAAVLISAANGAMAQASSRKFYAVICTADAGGPWTQKAQGTLTRTRSESEMSYKFESGAHTFEWRFNTSREGQTTALGPGFVMQRFDAALGEGERKQMLETTGEIRETLGSKRLALLLGLSCPGTKRR